MLVVALTITTVTVTITVTVAVAFAITAAVCARQGPICDIIAPMRTTLGHMWVTAIALYRNRTTMCGYSLSDSVGVGVPDF